MSKRTNAYIGLAVSVALFIGFGYFIYKPEAPNMAPYLSFSADLDGTKAFAELLREKEQTVKTWELPMKRLPSGGGEALLIIQPSQLADEELKALGSWMAQGNDVVLFTSLPPAWAGFQPNTGKTSDEAGGMAEGRTQGAGKTGGEEGGTVAAANGSVPVPSPSADRKAYAELRQLRKTGTAAGAEPLEAVVHSARRLEKASGVETLLEDELGAVGARQTIGDGSLTIVLAPNWLLNSEVLEHKQFELVWPLFERRWDTLWIDEYHHGIQTKPGLLAAYPEWLLAAGAQLALALALWLWMRAKRIGPVHAPRAWTVRRGDETLLAVAGWYERRKLRSEALAHSAERLRQLLWQRWGVAPGAAPQEAASAARIHWDADRASRLERLLHLAQPVQGNGAARPEGRGGTVSAREFTARMREYGECIADLEKE
ncbi:DUF4350 domain-containing protein [Paenibacillus sp. MBLB4367]|uniref:DUF4350 domain-containing protein n=1 Tax=Paenibacillus sp. MBLB4367 TaxID=3384767 RepID=UPI003907F894